jgi:hypothetical protein
MNHQLALPWQMLWVYVVSVTVLFINAEAQSAEDTPLGGWDFAGWGLFAGGFLLQASALHPTGGLQVGKLCAIAISSLLSVH